jgi:hypothetical protein
VIAGLMTLAAVEVVWTAQAVRVDEEAAVGYGPLAQAVRAATESFRDPQAGAAAGYMLSGGCVSGPEEGAMGVHFVNGSLVEDGMLDAARPEVLVYEPRDGGLRLVAVEYLVIAEQWDAVNDHPPVLEGQHFHYVPAPNRTGLPAYYELHVWAWKRNPHGTFADWNPRVSCERYDPE